MKNLVVKVASVVLALGGCSDSPVGQLNTSASKKTSCSSIDPTSGLTTTIESGVSFTKDSFEKDMVPYGEKCSPIAAIYFCEDGVVNLQEGDPAPGVFSSCTVEEKPKETPLEDPPVIEDPAAREPSPAPAEEISTINAQPQEMAQVLPVTPLISKITSVSQAVGFYKLQSVTVSGNLAYVTAGAGDISAAANPKIYGGLIVYDITNPAAPFIKKTYITYGPAMTSVQGDYAYQVGMDGKLYIINLVTDAITSKVLVGNKKLYSNCLSGNYLYAAEDYAGLLAVNITSKTLPTLSFQEALSYAQGNRKGNFAIDVACTNDYVYTTDYADKSIKIWDIKSTPGTPVLSASYVITGSTPGALFVNKGLAYVSDYGSAVTHVIDIITPYNPYKIATINASRSNTLLWGMVSAFSDRYIYLASGSGAGGAAIDLFDMETPAEPKLISSVTIYNEAKYTFGGIAVFGNYLFGANYGSSPGTGLPGQGTTGTLDVFSIAH